MNDGGGSFHWLFDGRSSFIWIPLPLLQEALQLQLQLQLLLYLQLKRKTYCNPQHHSDNSHCVRLVQVAGTMARALCSREYVNRFRPSFLCASDSLVLQLLSRHSILPSRETRAAGSIEQQHLTSGQRLCSIKQATELMIRNWTRFKLGS